MSCSLPSRTPTPTPPLVPRTVTPTLTHLLVLGRVYEEQCDHEVRVQLHLGHQGGRVRRRVGRPSTILHSHCRRARLRPSPCQRSIEQGQGH